MKTVTVDGVAMTQKQAIEFTAYNIAQALMCYEAAPAGKAFHALVKKRVIEMTSPQHEIAIEKILDAIAEVYTI